MLVWSFLVKRENCEWVDERNVCLYSSLLCISPCNSIQYHAAHWDFHWWEILYTPARIYSAVAKPGFWGGPCFGGTPSWFWLILVGDGPQITKLNDAKLATLRVLRNSRWRPKWWPEERLFYKIAISGRIFKCNMSIPRFWGPRNLFITIKSLLNHLLLQYFENYMLLWIKANTFLTFYCHSGLIFWCVMLSLRFWDKTKTACYNLPFKLSQCNKKNTLDCKEKVPNIYFLT